MRLCADPTHSKINNVIKEWFHDSVMHVTVKAVEKKERKKKREIKEPNLTEYNRGQ